MIGVHRYIHRQYRYLPYYLGTGTYLVKSGLPTFFTGRNMACPFLMALCFSGLSPGGPATPSSRPVNERVRSLPALLNRLETTTQKSPFIDHFLEATVPTVELYCPTRDRQSWMGRYLPGGTVWDSGRNWIGQSRKLNRTVLAAEWNS